MENPHRRILFLCTGLLVIVVAASFLANHFTQTNGHGSHRGASRYRPTDRSVRQFLTDCRDEFPRHQAILDADVGVSGITVAEQNIKQMVSQGLLNCGASDSLVQLIDDGMIEPNATLAIKCVLSGDLATGEMIAGKCRPTLAFEAYIRIAAICLHEGRVDDGRRLLKVGIDHCQDSKLWSFQVERLYHARKLAQSLNDTNTMQQIDNILTRYFSATDADVSRQSQLNRFAAALRYDGDEEDLWISNRDLTHSVDKDQLLFNVGVGWAHAGNAIRFNEAVSQIQNARLKMSAWTQALRADVPLTGELASLDFVTNIVNQARRDPSMYAYGPVEFWAEFAVATFVNRQTAEADYAIEQMRVLLNEFESEADSQYVMRLLARVLARCGHHEKSKNVLAEALASNRKLPDSVFRKAAERLVIEAAAECGLTDDAVAWLEAYRGDECLPLIAVVYSFAVGNADAERRIIRRLENEVATRNPAPERVDAIRTSIIVSLVDSRRFDEAIEFLNRIKTPVWRAIALYKLVMGDLENHVEPQLLNSMAVSCIEMLYLEIARARADLLKRGIDLDAFDKIDREFRRLNPVWEYGKHGVDKWTIKQQAKH